MTKEMVMRELVITKVRIGDIRPSALNPHWRTEKLDQLREEIVDYNGIHDPILLAKDYSILNGHRRYEACKQLGYPLVPCNASHLDPVNDWGRPNSCTQNYKGVDWLYSYTQDNRTLARCPKATKRKILICKEIFGSDAAIRKYMIVNRVSPAIVDHISEVDRTFRVQCMEPPPERTIGIWLIENRQSDQLDKYLTHLKYAENPKRMLAALSKWILGNKPIAELASFLKELDSKHPKNKKSK